MRSGPGPEAAAAVDTAGTAASRKAALGGEHQTRALASGGRGEGCSLGNCISISQEGAVPAGQDWEPPLPLPTLSLPSLSPAGYSLPPRPLAEQMGMGVGRISSLNTSLN